MTPALRLSFSLVLSLLLWLPTVPSALAASEDPAMIALRYLVALVISRIGVGMVFRVVSGYAGEVLLATEEKESPVAAPTPDSQPDGDRPARRREDDAEADEHPAEAETMLDEALEDVRDTAALVP